MALPRTLAGKPILVTGGAGFIGSHLVRALHAACGDLHVMVSSASDLRRVQDLRSSCAFYRGDLRDEVFVHETVKRAKPRVVYHLADYGVQAGQTDSLIMASVNVMGLANLLSALQNTAVECLVTCGSSAEYGPCDHPMEEGQILRPMTAYGATKASGTLLAQAYGATARINTISLRLFYVYGQGDAPTRFVPTAIRACRMGEPLALTSREEKRDFVYIDDVVRAFLLAYTANIQGYHIVNVGSSRESSLGDAIRGIEKHVGKKIQVQERTYPNRPWSSACWAANIEKARRLLGWSPQYTLASGLKEILAVPVEENL